VVVALSGEIDIASAPEVRAALAEAASHAVTGMIIDLGAVTFMDAAGLGVLAEAFRRTRHLPGGLRLVAVPARVQRLLAITGLAHLGGFAAPPGAVPAPVSPEPAEVT
jgi:anti-sigma B factor antagonist